jgi:hypothetical protein
MVACHIGNFIVHLYIVFLRRGEVNQVMKRIIKTRMKMEGGLRIP